MLSEILSIAAALAVGFLVLTLPFVAFGLTVASWREVRRLRARVDALEAAVHQPGVSGGEPAVAESATVPVVPVRPAAESRAAEQPAAEPTTAASPTEGAPAAVGPEPVAPAGGGGSDAGPQIALPAPPARPPRPPITAERLAVWVGSGVGALLVLLASLLGLAVAIDKGWLGPAARVFLGLGGAGAGFVLAQALHRRGHRWVSSAVAGAAVGVVHGALWAATARYHLLERPVAGAFMVATTAVALWLATRWRERLVAHLGLLGGFATPLLLSTGQNAPVPLFLYVGVLSAGGVAAAARRGWPDVAGLAALGAGTLFLGWSAEWREPDQVSIGLLAPLWLAIPFAVAAAWSGSTAAVRGVGMVAVLAVPLQAAPWALPVDARFVDPRTGVEVVRSFGPAPWVVALALPWLLLPAALVGRLRQDPRVSGAAGVLLGLVVVSAAGEWGAFEGVDVQAKTAIATGALLLACVLAALRGFGLGTAALPVATGLALATVLGVQPRPDTEPALAVAFLAVAGVAVAWRERSAAWLVSAALGLLFASWAAANEVVGLGARAVGGPALVALACLVPLPALALRWSHRPEVPVLVGAAAGPLLFFPLHEAWVEGLGDSVIGLLPLGLGALAAGTAALLSRARRVHAGDAAFTLFVAVALLGVSAAVPLQLERQWLTVAWAVLGLLLAALAPRLVHPLVRVASVGLGVAVAVRLLVNPAALSYGEAGGLPVLNWTLYTWGIPGLCLVGSAALLARSSTAPVPPFVPPLLRVLGVLTGFALVHVEVSHAFQDAGPIELGGHGLLQGMVRSIAWAVYGVVVLVLGLRSGHRHVRLVGFGLVLVAAAKVFVVDLWQMSGFVRVGSVLGLGVTLLLSAFLFERLVLRREPGPPEAP